MAFALVVEGGLDEGCPSGDVPAFGTVEKSEEPTGLNGILIGRREDVGIATPVAGTHSRPRRREEEFLCDRLESTFPSGKDRRVVKVAHGEIDEIDEIGGHAHSAPRDVEVVGVVGVDLLWPQILPPHSEK